jgi:DNA-binding MarR family transcriptional regulator
MCKIENCFDILGDMVRLLDACMYRWNYERGGDLMEQMDPYAMRYCACANIRRADRLVRQFYDQILEPSGLLITQFTLLRNLMTMTSPVTVQRLAEVLGMDRTTLTRNLEVLLRQEWVRVEEGPDRRTRLVSLTKQGIEIYERALPYWRNAQAQIVEKLGAQRLQELLETLYAMEGVIQ